MMDWVIVGILAFAVWHYVVDGIIGPSMRAELRFDMFAIRDRLREIRAVEPERMTPDAFKIIHQAVNATIQVLPVMSLYGVVSLRRTLAKDLKLPEELKRLVAFFESLSDDELRELCQKTFLAGRRALVVNTFGWVAFLPIIVGAAKLNGLYQQVKYVLALPAGEFRRVAPDFVSDPAIIAA